MPELFDYITADGQTFSLTDMVAEGVQGRFMPPIELIEDEVPEQAGSRLRQVNIKAREIDLPLQITATSELEMRQLIWNMLDMFNPDRGTGKLRITGPGGSQRELYCQYSSGLDISERKLALLNQKTVLVLRAFDPYWYDLNTLVQTFTIGQSAKFFPIFPLRLSSSSVFADITVNNDGDAQAFPEWIITGPGSGITLRNLSTGKSLTIDTTLDSGETLTIVTKIFEKSVTKNDGADLYGLFTFESDLWSLKRGSNSIRIEMTNATTDSSVQLSYRNRYLGA